jgi:bifunctional DNA-binding transcriptional regulator/antitoxin component of YhaV-PrlF toxin-antitoxin module
VFAPQAVKDQPWILQWRQILPSCRFIYQRPYPSLRGSFKEHAMTVVHGRVSGSGRLSIPAEFRKAVGLERGGDVVVELDGREIRIRTVGEVIAQARALTQRLIGDKPEASVDAFLSERRREAARE